MKRAIGALLGSEQLFARVKAWGRFGGKLFKHLFKGVGNGIKVLVAWAGKALLDDAVNHVKAFVPVAQRIKEHHRFVMNAQLAQCQSLFDQISYLHYYCPHI